MSRYPHVLVVLIFLLSFSVPARADTTKPANAATQNSTAEENSEPGAFTTRCPAGQTYISSEELQGVLLFEIGDIDWGRQSNATKNGTAEDGGAKESGREP